MPNLITHYLLAQDVLEHLDDGYLKECINNYPKEFNIGSSGPDFLFYYDVLPWQNRSNNKRVARYGGVVHSEKINEFYDKALESCHKETDEKLKQAMFSFLAGHLCHWALDSNAHPMIFYRTNGTTKETRYWHFRYESMIDTMMVKVVKQKPLANYASKDILEYDDYSAKAISNIYTPVLKQLWNYDLSEDMVLKSLKDFRKTSGILFNPSRTLFKLLQGIESLVGHKWLFTSHMVIDEVDNDHDVLNINHTEWLNPADTSLKSSASFIDLYKQAETDALRALDFVSQTLNGNSSQKLLRFLSNRSYETGLSELKEMTDFKAIY